MSSSSGWRIGLRRGGEEKEKWLQCYSVATGFGQSLGWAKLLSGAEETVLA